MVESQKHKSEVTVTYDKVTLQFKKQNNLPFLYLPLSIYRELKPVGPYSTAQ